MSEIRDAAEERMKKAIAALHDNFTTVRTGRANAMILDRIKVDYYGVQTPINQMAAVKTPDAHMLVVEPWDKSALREMIAYVNSFDFSAYSDINSLRVAMFNAEQTMADEEATQEEVNAAKEALEAELKALTPKSEASTDAAGNTTGETTNTAAAAQTGLFAGVLAAAAGALLAVRRRKNQE